MRAIIVDNEQPIREGLKSLLETFCPDVHLLGEADGVESGFNLIHTVKPELVFLDVEMDDGTGMDLLAKFNHIDFQVIFATAHDKYAINAFRFSAVDFILKPVDPEDLMNAVEKAKEKQKQQTNKQQIDFLLDNLKGNQTEKIILKDADSIHVVKMEDIICLEAQGSYTKFSVNGIPDILVSKNLKEYEQILDSSKFFRPHHSFLINLSKVIRFDKKDGGLLILENKVEAPVSVRKKDLLLEKISHL